MAHRAIVDDYGGTECHGIDPMVESSLTRLVMLSHDHGGVSGRERSQQETAPAVASTAGASYRPQPRLASVEVPEITT